jgi:hypothetical protein
MWPAAQSARHTLRGQPRAGILLLTLYASLAQEILLQVAVEDIGQVTDL